MIDLNESIQVVRTMKQIMDNMKQKIGCRFKEMGLTRPQGMLLGTLIRYEKMKISDLSEELELSNSTVSGILDRLEKQSLIMRTRSDVDRRVVYVEVTPEFKKISDNSFKEIEKLIAEKISKIGPEEMKKLNEGLSILKKIME